MWALERIGLQESGQVNGAGFILEMLEMNMNIESSMWGEKRREPEPVESWNVCGGKSKSLRRGVRGKKGGGGKVRSLITGV